MSRAAQRGVGGQAHAAMALRDKALRVGPLARHASHARVAAARAVLDAAVKAARAPREQGMVFAFCWHMEVAMLVAGKHCKQQALRLLYARPRCRA